MKCSEEELHGLGFSHVAAGIAHFTLVALTLRISILCYKKDYHQWQNARFHVGDWVSTPQQST